MIRAEFKFSPEHINPTGSLMTEAPLINEPIQIDFESFKKRKQSFLPGHLLEEEQQRKSKWSKGAVFMPDGSALIYDKTTVSKFVTGSKYVGQWNALGISGKGIYEFPHGVIYDGYFNTVGEFHGSGMIIYPGGQKIEGFWKNGKLISGAISKDRCQINDDYCKMPDRRFQLEIESELQPANHENLTNNEAPIVIPEGCYDVGEGFYDPKFKVIRDYENLSVARPLEEFAYWLDEQSLKYYFELLYLSPTENEALYLLKALYANKSDIISVPNRSREEWIQLWCRKAWDEPIGFRPEFYETWTSGSIKYDDKIESESQPYSTESMDSSVASTYIQNFYTIGTAFDMSTLETISKSSQRSTDGNLMFVNHINAEEMNRVIFEALKKRNYYNQESKRRKYAFKHHEKSPSFKNRQIF